MADILRQRLLTLETASPSFAFSTEEGRALALQALTHSSLSNNLNNTDLARVGELAANAATTERLFLTKGKRPSGADYNQQLQHFTSANLGRLGRKLGLERVLFTGGGLTTISDSMVADCLKALFGAVKLSQGQDALLELLERLEIK